jgi:hypothetical protein
MNKKQPPMGPFNGTNEHISEEMPNSGIAIAQKKRAEENGISRATQQNLDWLARYAPGHLKRVQNGALSVHRACIQAGHIKEVTSLQAGTRAWTKMSPDEKDQFLAFLRQEEKQGASL